ncbi:MAG: hypothetical protein SVZ03_10945 [Spirochaetota bacterium]|nr:hypothetical protein [Spirochaetota bacterium]
MKTLIKPILRIFILFSLLLSTELLSIHHHHNSVDQEDCPICLILLSNQFKVINFFNYFSHSIISKSEKLSSEVKTIPSTITHYPYYPNAPPE